LKIYCNLKIKFLLLFGITLVQSAIAITILVGTTGDYPPLTEKTATGFTGKDIEIITAFAKDKQLNIQFVATSWPTLSNDLLKGKFTLAVGGISATTKQRNKVVGVIN
jgi:cyclohexadienyl dehydratase